MATSPGTVSKILWHFTGGPTWNAERNRQNRKPKPAADAYRAFVGILESREVRIGQYKEVVKVRIPKYRHVDPKTRKARILLNHLIQLESRPVCCVADIPIQHLSYHARRYGKFAIGFHRNAVAEKGFNPVFYTLHETHPLRSIYKGMAELSNIKVSDIEFATNDIESAVQEAECEKGHSVEIDIDYSTGDIQMAAQSIEEAADSAKEAFSRFLAYVKTFDKKEFNTIYCEREWRSVKPFQFEYDDIAMLVLPRHADKDYYCDYLTNYVGKLNFPSTAPIVPWEVLIEH